MKVPEDLLKAHIDNVSQRLERFRYILDHSCQAPISSITFKQRVCKQGVSGLYAAYTENGLEHTFYLSRSSTMFSHDYELKIINPDEPAYDAHVRHLLSTVKQISGVISTINPETVFNSFDFNAGYEQHSFTWLFSCGFVTELYGYIFEYAID